jgi:outer membrane lipoprotein SlyB
MMNTVNVKPTMKKGSGGLFGSIGKIAGAALGGAAGFIGSGFNPGGAVAGAGLGSNLGGTAGAVIGEKVDPSKVKNTKTVAPLQSMKTGSPEVQIAVLQQAKSQLPEMKDLSKDQFDSIYSHLDNAQSALASRLKR